MKTTDYQKLISSIASKLESEILKQDEITTFIKDNLGYTFRDYYQASGIDNMDDYDKRAAFNKEYLPLFQAFLGMIQSFNEINKYPSDFNVKTQSLKIHGYYQTLKKYIDDDNYERILLELLEFISSNRDDLKLTDERIKVLYRKYIY